MVSNLTKAKLLVSLELRTSLQVSTLPYGEKSSIRACSDSREGPKPLT
jgi:hypothetical protein